MKIRPIRSAEVPLLTDFLYLAVFVPEGAEAPPRDVIFHPGVYAYVENFGEKDDVCLVAEWDGRIIGAAWSRILSGNMSSQDIRAPFCVYFPPNCVRLLDKPQRLAVRRLPCYTKKSAANSLRNLMKTSSEPGRRGYGNIDPYTPELAIAVLPEFRGRGVGAALLNALFDRLAGQNYSRLSLSVQKDNPAFRLYRRVGFEILRDNGEDFIMVKKLADCEIVIDKLHTTPMGAERVRRNLGLGNVDVVEWCKTAVKNAPEFAIVRRGKSWYVSGEGFVLTVNAQSHTIITAHKVKP